MVAHGPDGRLGIDVDPLPQILRDQGIVSHRVVQVDSGTLSLGARRTDEAPQVETAALPMGGAGLSRNAHRRDV